MRETKLEVNKTHLLYNLNVFKNKIHTKTKILVNLKANAYGIGAVETGKFLSDQAVDYFSVAYINEGVHLRKNQINTSIIVFNPSIYNFKELVDFHLEPAVSSLFYLKKLYNYLSAGSLFSFPIHLKLDTGMHRAGILPEQLPEVIDFLAKHHKYFQLKSVYSHLSASEDPKEDQFTYSQIALFEKMTDELRKKLNNSFFRHLLNTAGIFRFPQAQYDMIRPGLGIYGYSLIRSQINELKPVARMVTNISQVKTLKKGQTVGYNRNFTVLKNHTKIALLPIGYGDGFCRKLGQSRYKVKCKHYLLPVVGNVSMDAISVDVTGTDCKPGDQVIIFDNQYNVYEMADLLQTIPYEIITGISARVPRVWID